METADERRSTPISSGRVDAKVIGFLLECRACAASPGRASAALPLSLLTLPADPRSVMRTGARRNPVHRPRTGTRRIGLGRTVPLPQGVHFLLPGTRPRPVPEVRAAPARWVEAPLVPRSRERLGA